MEELVALLTQHGVLLVFVATLAARIGAPIPAAPILVVAGGLTAASQLSGIAVFGISLLANVAGDALWFWSGRHYGHRVMRLLCRISMSPDSCVRQSEFLITRWGGHSLVAAKFVPGVSVVAAPMAGALAMPWLRFIAWDLLAGALWTGAYLGIGMLFSAQIEHILALMADAGAVALAGLVLVIAVLLGLRYWRRRRFLRAVDMPRISVEELQALMRDGREPVIVDVRSAASVEVDARRIPGALSISLDEVVARAAGLPRDREIVLYCNCPNEVSAARAAQLLAAQGFAQVRALNGGLDAWAAAQLEAQGRPAGAVARHAASDQALERGTD